MRIIQILMPPRQDFQGTNIEKQPSVGLGMQFLLYSSTSWSSWKARRSSVEFASQYIIYALQDVYMI